VVKKILMQSKWIFCKH